jgi:hypothetical protein
MKDPTDQFIQRTQTYWYTDGLAEIGMTFICLVLSAYFYGQATLAPNSFLFRVLDVGFLLILVVSGIITRKLVTTFKTRLTYPRTGYVNDKQPKPAHCLGSTVIGLILSAALILIFSRYDHIEAYMSAATGILIGAALMFFAYRSRVLRFYLLAAISVLLGSGLSLSDVGDMLGLSYYYGWMALVVLALGLLTLRGYLIKTKALEG